MNENGEQLFLTQTLGLSPEVLTKDVIEDRLANNFELSKNRDKVSHLYFYGAGCGTDRMKLFLKGIFKDFFPNAKADVKEDTYAAIFATTKVGHQGIVCILGTGSNCSYYDGNQLFQKVTSLGYIPIENKEHPYAKGVIDKGFQQFINNYVMQFELATKVPINFVGSIAHYLRDELTSVLLRNDLIVGVIRQRPIEGLVDFHRANM